MSQQNQLPTMGQLPDAISGTTTAGIARRGLMDMSTGMCISDANKSMGVGCKLLYCQAIPNESVP